MFRKILPILLLFLVAAQLVGFDIYFYSEKAKIKKQLKTFIKQGVPKNQLCSFQFSLDEIKKLNWTKPNKEFKIGEKYYDVVWRKNKKGISTYQCVDDVQETKLFRNLAIYLDKNLGDQNKHSFLGFVFNCLNTPSIVNNFRFEFQQLKLSEKQLKFSFYFRLLTEGHYSIVLPPPSFC